MQVSTLIKQALRVKTLDKTIKYAKLKVCKSLKVKETEVTLKPPFTYKFGVTGTTGDSNNVNLLGGKGAKLCALSDLGIPVPSGIILPTAVCTYFLAASAIQKQNIVRSIVKQDVLPYLTQLEKVKGSPSLYSVRSGARVSMAGMMDTVLNVGISFANVDAHAEVMGASAAYDCLRRLLMMYTEVVLGLDMSEFEDEVSKVCVSMNVATPSGLPYLYLKELCERINHRLSDKFLALPDSLEDQLVNCVYAVFNSWLTPRAKHYRVTHNLPETWGTAATIQEMVFGNLNDNSGSGVLFTACPSTGEYDPTQVVGEYLPNAQGEDVVSGTKTPLPLTQVTESGILTPDQYHELVTLSHAIADHFNDMQDIEFTIENGKLYILQTRDAKRTSVATLKYATTMYATERWDVEQVCSKVKRRDIFRSISPYKVSDEEAIAVGIGAGGSIVTGVPAFTHAQVSALHAQGTSVIFVTHETSPNDIMAMTQSVGVLTFAGGLTSHAAVVARGMNLTAVVGCGGLTKDLLVNRPLLSIDGLTGEVFDGAVTVETGGSKLVEGFVSTVFGHEATDYDTLQTDEEGVTAAIDLISKRTDKSPLVVEYSSTHADVVASVYGDQYCPTGLFILSHVLNDLLTKNEGSFYLSCPNEYTELITAKFPKLALIKEAETLADLIGTKLIRVKADTWSNVCGSVSAANTIKRSLLKTGIELASAYTPSEDPLKKACSKLED